MSTIKQCTNCPGATDHDTAHCPLFLLRERLRLNEELPPRRRRESAMSDVKRIWLAWEKRTPERDGPNCRTSEWRNDLFVLAEHYDTLEAEAHALREELKNRTAECNGLHEMLRQEHDRTEKARGEVVAANDRADTLVHRMMGMMTRHFADAWRNRDTTKELDGYLSAGIAELERERNAALAEIEALRARVIVVPERVDPNYFDSTRATGIGWNACLDKLVRLNGKTVSEGMLRSIVSIYFRSVIDEAHWTDMHGEIEELRALLDGEPT